MNVDKTCAEYFNGLMEKLEKKGGTKEGRGDGVRKGSGKRKEEAESVYYSLKFSVLIFHEFWLMISMIK